MEVAGAQSVDFTGLRAQSHRFSGNTFPNREFMVELKTTACQHGEPGGVDLNVAECRVESYV